MLSIKTTKPWKRCLGLAGILAATLAGCSSGAPFNDPASDYTQRILTVSPTAGNAQAANTVIQTPGPWPAVANNVNIPGNGEKTVKAIKKYQSGDDSGGPATSLSSSPQLTGPAPSTQ